MAFYNPLVRIAQCTLQPLFFPFTGVQSKAGLVGMALNGRKEG